MLFPIVPLEEWCKAHDLKVRTRKCHNCKEKLSTTVPYADKYGFGLVSPKCSCGNGGQVCTSKLRNNAFSAIYKGEAFK